MIDCRCYSRWFRLLAQKVTSLKVPLVLATDAYCRWASEATPHALQVGTDSGRFWDNNAPITSMLNLLVEDVIEQLGDSAYEHLDAATELRYRPSSVSIAHPTARRLRMRNRHAKLDSEAQ